MTSPSYDADVLVVGAGPAGVAAAVMAASLQQRTVVVEAGRVGDKLHTVGSLENVSGGWSTGPQLAQALARDLDRLQEAGRCAVVQARAVAVNSCDDRAELTLDDGRVLTAQTIVVATGVVALTPADAGWMTAPDDLTAPPLWRATPDSIAGCTYVLGADRPLGTWLRTHPEASATLHVLCPPEDEYKAVEVAGDDRVRLVPVSHVAVTRSSYNDGWTVEAKDREGLLKSHAATTVLNNLGSKPAALEGLALGEDGYCPPGQQHRRIQIAGDLRSARFQRIATAQGSGAEAVLACYYANSPQSGGGGGSMRRVSVSRMTPPLAFGVRSAGAAWRASHQAGSTDRKFPCPREVRGRSSEPSWIRGQDLFRSLARAPLPGSSYNRWASGPHRGGVLHWPGVA